MAKPSVAPSSCVEIDGRRYVILRENVYRQLCEKAGVAPGLNPADTATLSPAVALDRASLAEKLRRRRIRTGLSQAELARRAGVRPETLNRIERGRTNPDFATVRKLVVAMDAAEEVPLSLHDSTAVTKEPGEGQGKHDAT